MNKRTHPTAAEQLAARHLLEKSLTFRELLDAVCYAFNVIPNTRMSACPHGFKDTYALIAAIEDQMRRGKHLEMGDDEHD